jgi:CRP-like cAMP-binding protein
MLLVPTTHRELGQVTLLDGLSPNGLAWVSRLSTPVELPAGHVLARQGQRGTEFFVVMEGQVDVLQDGALVARRGAGEPLGEIALLGQRPRTATLVARTPVRARVASRQEFSGLLAEIPELSQRLHAAMEERLAS